MNIPGSIDAELKAARKEGVEWAIAQMRATAKEISAEALICMRDGYGRIEKASRLYAEAGALSDEASRIELLWDQQGAEDWRQR